MVSQSGGVNGFGKNSSFGNGSVKKCFKCGKFGHMINECEWNTKKCFRCEKPGHRQIECKWKPSKCFSCAQNKSKYNVSSVKE